MAERTGIISFPSFDTDGAERWPMFGKQALEELERLFCKHGSKPGVRLTDISSLDRLIGPASKLCRLASKQIGRPARPVRAIAFDKSPAVNWSLGWHQDRTICVKRRADVPGFGPWTVKQGIDHVQPPFAVTREMVTARIHIDAVDADNAPLKIALGTHRMGQIPDAEAEGVALEHPVHGCLADPGDVWLYATPIIHASDRSRSRGRRRVLQVDYSASTLPAPLEWLLG